MRWVGSLRTKAFALLALCQSTIDYWANDPGALASYRRALRDGRIRYRLDPNGDEWIHPSEIDFDLGIVWIDCEELASFGAADAYLRGERDLWIGMLLEGGPLAHAVYWLRGKGLDPSVDVGMPVHPLWATGTFIRLPVTYTAPTIGRMNNGR